MKSWTSTTTATTQMVVVRLTSGETLRLRLLTDPAFAIGQRVGVAARGEPFVFPRSGS